MEPDCRKITKEILPAIRASIAEIMEEEYHYGQADIAKRLDVVQVAVSKYLNGKYSPKVARMKEYVTKRGLTRGIVEDMVKGRNVDAKMNELCNELFLRSVA